MNIKYSLDTVVSSIVELSGGSKQKTKKFEGSQDEYLLSDVTEEMLIELGFEFKGYTCYGAAPYYEKGNILAYFDDVVLHVMEQTYSAI